MKKTISMILTIIAITIATIAPVSAAYKTRSVVVVIPQKYSITMSNAAKINTGIPSLITNKAIGCGVIVPSYSKLPSTKDLKKIAYNYYR